MRPGIIYEEQAVTFYDMERLVLGVVNAERRAKEKECGNNGLYFNCLSYLTYFFLKSMTSAVGKARGISVLVAEDIVPL